MLADEAEGLVKEMQPTEKNVSGRTRGAKVDAYKQEKSADRAVDGACK